LLQMRRRQRFGCLSKEPSNAPTNKRDLSGRRAQSFESWNGR
jgi:hypothetical protein